ISTGYPIHHFRGREHPDRTSTGRRRRAYEHEETPWHYVTVSPPVLLGARENLIEARCLGPRGRCRFSSFLSFGTPLGWSYAGFSPICRPGVFSSICH